VRPRVPTTTSSALSFFAVSQDGNFGKLLGDDELRFDLQPIEPSPKTLRARRQHVFHLQLRMGHPARASRPLGGGVEADQTSKS